MKIFHSVLAAVSAAFFFTSVALAQNPGAVTNHAFAIGKGAGQGGFTSLLCGSAQLAVGQSAADPICRTMSGDATLAASGALTLATVNSNVGSFGSATQCVTFTVNAKGLVTAASAATCTPAVGSITGLGTGVATWLATPSSANLASAITDETGSGALVFANSPALTTPNLGTPSAATLTNATGLPVSTGISGLGTGIATWLATPSSANLRAALTDETGTGAAYFAGGALGTPSSGTLTNATGLPVSTGISGLGTGIATWLATPSSANLASALTDETGSGAAVFGTSPTIGGVANFSGAFKLSTETAPSQITSNQNDYNPSSVNCVSSSTLILTTDASRTVSGLAAPAAGCEMTVINGGTNDLVLSNEDTNSTAANRFGFGANITLTTKQACKLRYDGTNSRWRALGCQGSGGGGGSVTTTYPLSGTSSLSWIGPTHAGRLDYSSSTSIKFNPYNGDIIRIQGAVYQIPSAGVDCGNPSGGVFLNGSGSSSLSGSTTYYVYVFNNSGTLACDFSTTAYAVDSTAGNIGTYIKSGVASRSLIGMVRIGGSVAYTYSATQRFVVSWFNRQPVHLTNALTSTATQGTTCGAGPTPTFGEVSSAIRIEFLAWSNVPVLVMVSGSFFNSGANTNLASVGIDGTTGEDVFAVMTGTSAQPLALSHPNTYSEGYHYATILNCVSAGTASYYVFGNAAGGRTTIKGLIQG